MNRHSATSEESQHVIPYFDDLLERFDAGDQDARIAFGRHVHWGYWHEPREADGTPQDYATAAERLCRLVCDAAEIRSGMRILDVGCGIGGTIASLNDRFSELELVGLNIDARQLQVAAQTIRAQNGNKIEFVHGDACRLDFHAAPFDEVLAVECIFHFDSRHDFFRGVARTLKPAGRLALSDFVPPSKAMPSLEQIDLAKDHATLHTFGRINVSCPIEKYRRLGGAQGLCLTANTDITAGTMPTYPFLRANSKKQSNRAAMRTHTRAISRLETACMRGLLNYEVLSFSKTNDALAERA